MSQIFKDHFSKQSNLYSVFRPTYPDELFTFLSEVSPGRKLAWDCATGNGQTAVQLSKYFQKVLASDASKEQIGSAIKKENIIYEVFPAESANLENSSVDLITVAQALHWFHFEKFYSEARRVLVKGGILAVWSYGLHHIDPEIDKIIYHFYSKTVGKYWPKERTYVEEKYETIPFPFDPIDTPNFKMSLDWNLNELLGYLRTWSSVQRYIDENRTNPIELIEKEIRSIWKDPEEKKKVVWPLYRKVGRFDENGK